ncbi:MAG: phage antirepressor KilAC domain-containing protein [Romboutsia sp.]|uniref:phage antirepressor KilAC domain-containing protein n=1 Tax=Romboutsia sp. TaxID=1965302 RepID=UPI003F2E21C3
MHDLKIFENEEYGKINVIVENNKEYFEASKIAKILGYSNPQKAIRDHCEKEGITIRSVGVATGYKLDGSISTQNVNKNFIDEGNLYRLIIKSKLPKAKAFEKWVVQEILPTIRKHGAYIEDDLLEELLKSPEFLKKLLNNLKDEKEKVQKLNKEIKENKPYVSIGKVVGECEDAISIGAFSKLVNSLGINIGRNRLFAWFRHNDYLMKQGLENQPKQKYIDQGLFKTRQFAVNTSSGPKIVVTTYITGKGQKYFIELIKGDFGYEKNHRFN